MYKSKWFTLKELVSPAVYQKFGDFAWNFLDKGMLKDNDLLRDLWGKALFINTWGFGGQYKESGFRCNTDSIVKAKKIPYCSAHVLGRGFDIKPELIEDVPKLYELIKLNFHKFSTVSRMENIKCTPTWIHWDNLEDRSNKIIIF